ncbi:sensor histidine kinase [Flavobacterium sp. RHBU_24]|uniref:sensor histidine kinase n=1 Tax=Flavobacterium sp. RHBU_24 TaxID=3391185 RepID=UPI00398546C2
MNSLDKYWFFRYKIHHLIFWLVYHFIWTVYYKDSPSHGLEYMQTAPGFAKLLSFGIFQAIGVYFCLYWLIPNFLKKGKYLQFMCLLIVTLAAMSVLSSTGYFLGAYLIDKPVEQLYGLNGKNPVNLLKIEAFPASVSSMTLGMSIKLTKNWLESQERQRLLEKEKLEAELNFLKAQINPHFLFNTFNSIFVLINKNPNLASEALSQFSDLLRYQLYECGGNSIPLGAECNYLENYILLERLRYDLDNPKIQLDIDLKEDSYFIAPFILMPFVENAFKHFDRQTPSVINISLRADNKKLALNVENSVSPKIKKTLLQESPHPGIGLSNVKRRLLLQYPDNHALIIKIEENRFKVNLELNLTVL